MSIFGNLYNYATSSNKRPPLPGDSASRGGSYYNNITPLPGSPSLNLMYTGKPFPSDSATRDTSNYRSMIPLPGTAAANPMYNAASGFMSGWGDAMRSGMDAMGKFGASIKPQQPATTTPMGPTHTGAVQESNHDRLMQNQDPGNVANFGVQMPYAGGGSFHNTAQNVARNFAAMAGQNQNRRPIIGKDKDGNQVILGYETVNPAQQTTDAWADQMKLNQMASQRNSDRASKERMMDKMLAAFDGNRSLAPAPAPVPVGSSGRFNAPQLSSLPVAVQNIRGPGAHLTGDPIADKRNIALANARNRAAQAYRHGAIPGIAQSDQSNAAAAAQQQTRDLLAAVGDRRLALGQEANDNSTLMRLMGLLS